MALYTSSLFILTDYIAFCDLILPATDSQRVIDYRPLDFFSAEDKRRMYSRTLVEYLRFFREEATSNTWPPFLLKENSSSRSVPERIVVKFPNPVRNDVSYGVHPKMKLKELFGFYADNVKVSITDLLFYHENANISTLVDSPLETFYSEDEEAIVINVFEVPSA